jgi:ferredoxin
MQRHLKKTRVVISLLFFLVISLYFIDFTGFWHSKPTHAFLHLQFIPSLLLFIGTLEAVALGFAIVLVLTLLFGRIYCSTICPLGTLQDIFIYLSGKLSPRRQIFKHKEPNNWLRYGFLTLTVVSFLSGFIILVNLLDPYSAFGKMGHNLAWPVVTLGNNLTAFILSSFGVFALYPVKWAGLNVMAFGFALGWLVLLLYLTVKRGRLYCNTVCPVGSLLGLFSRISLFRIVLDKNSCNSCGKCSAVCKAECINPKTQELDFSRCVGCMNCLSPCPDSGVKFRPAWKKNQPAAIKKFDPSRRNLFRNSGILVVGAFAAGQDSLLMEEKKEVIPGTVPIFREHPVTPPGAISQERFNDYCTACHLCVSACPTQVLQPAYFMYGIKGILQPRMDYITSFCNFECTLCGEVCPTGAILPLPLPEKKLTQLGISRFVKENCIVYTRKTDCGACSEHCPTKAVKMVPYEGRLTIPEVTKEICIGCGACEHPCPTDPKAIYVEGNVIHERAQEPKKAEVQKEVDYKEEFPF